jgi:hypothetical protein
MKRCILFEGTDGDVPPLVSYMLKKRKQDKIKSPTGSSRVFQGWFSLGDTGFKTGLFKDWKALLT